jgi:hypothetical protein
MECHGQGTADQVAAFIKFSNSTARKYLYELRTEKLVHTVDSTRLPHGGRSVIFKFGQAPAAVVVAIVATGNGATPFRPVTTIYPPNHRRDFLVCAMFGVPPAMLGAQV